MASRGPGKDPRRDGGARDRHLLRRLLVGILLAIVAFAAGHPSPAVLLGFAVVVAAPRLAVYVSFMLASLARTVAVGPGGLGTFEVVAIATLRAGGVQWGAALAATLLFRGVSFWLPMPGWWLAHAETVRGGAER